MLPPGVKWLLIANGALFLIQNVIGKNQFDQYYLHLWFGLTPVDLWRGAFWQPFTYMFLHGNFGHLLINMLLLWMFGSVLESVWQTREFLRYYFITGVGPGLINSLVIYDQSAPIVGASGAIYGLLAAYGIMFPNAKILLYFLFPIRAKYLVMILGLFAFVASLRTIGGEHSSTAHIVHLGGMVIGVIYLKRKDMVSWGARRAKTWQKDKEQRQTQRRIIEDDRLRQEVDDLLDKINEVGLDNLTSWERQRLREASEKLRQREEDKL